MYEPLVIWMVMTICIQNSAYSLIAPFLPIEFERKGVPEAYVGMIFAIFSIGIIFCSPVVGKVYNRIGHKNLLAGGIGGMGLMIICFGFIENMTNRVNIIVISLILRFL